VRIKRELLVERERIGHAEENAGPYDPLGEKGSEERPEKPASRGVIPADQGNPVIQKGKTQTVQKEGKKLKKEKNKPGEEDVAEKKIRVLGQAQSQIPKSEQTPRGNAGKEEKKLERKRTR